MAQAITGTTDSNSSAIFFSAISNYSLRSLLCKILEIRVDAIAFWGVYVAIAVV